MAHRVTWRRALALAAALALCSPAPAAILRVRAHSSAPSPDGASWETAYPTVAAAAAKSLAGDEIWVAAGTYGPVTLKTAGALYGGFRGWESTRSERSPSEYESVLDANIPSPPSTFASVVTVQTAPSTPVTIDGFTIQNGTGTSFAESAYSAHTIVYGHYVTCGGGILLRTPAPVTISNNKFRNNRLGTGYDWPDTTDQGLGGAISSEPRSYIDSSPYGHFPDVSIKLTSVHILDNTFDGNDGGDGGAIGLRSGTDVRISGNTFTNNAAYRGGAVYAATCTVANNTFRTNQAHPVYVRYFFYSDLATYPGLGGAVYCTNGRFTGNTFIGNQASGYGGAVMCGDSVFRGNRFIGNSAPLYVEMSDDGPDVMGVGASGAIDMALSGTTAEVRDNVFSQNTSAGSGAAVSIYRAANLPAGTLVGFRAFASNTLTANVGAAGSGALVATADAYSPIASNIVAANSGGIEGTGVGLTLSHNDVWSNAGADYLGTLTAASAPSDISQDPLFRSGQTGDFGLQPSSPCIDAGDDAAVAPGETDYVRQPRIVGAHADIGAQEFLAIHLEGGESLTDSRAGAVLSGQPGVWCVDGSDNTQTQFTGPVTAAIRAGTGTPGARLLGTTTVTASSGHASFHDLSLDRNGLGYVLVFSSPGLPSVESVPFNVMPGYQLAFSPPPASGPLGDALPPVTVALQDAGGNGSKAVSVTLALVPDSGTQGAVLSGMLTRGTSGGVATFTDLKVDRAGAGFVLSATAPGCEPAVSQPFGVTVPRVYVSQAGSDAAEGVSWATAKKTPALAVLEATPGTGEVWVAAGTYGPLTLPAGVKLFGGFAGAETAFSQRDFRRNATTLAGASPGSVVTIQPGAGLDTVLDGFTITGGGGTVMSSLSGGEVMGSSSGGGIYCVGASPRISHNVITGNVLFIEEGSDPVTGIRIHIGPGAGAGIYCRDASPVITFNRFTANRGSYSGSAIGAYGGNPTISCNIVAGETDNPAVAVSAGSVEFNTIVGNGTPSGYASAALSLTGGRAWNNIVAFNAAGVSLNANADFRCNDVYGNAGANFKGWNPGLANGNIQSDPLFVDRAQGDLHLGPGSPCIDAADGSIVPPGSVDYDGNPRVMGAGADMGAFETAGPVRLDATALKWVLRYAAGLATADLLSRNALDLVASGPPGIDIADAVAIARKLLAP